MNKLKLITLILLLFNKSVVAFAMDSGPTTDEALAVTSVHTYMNALIAGDIAQIRALLAPRLLTERQKLLDNPMYAQRLQEAYSNASFEVVDQLWVGSDKVQVDVRIQLNPQDVVHSRFELIRVGDVYRILSEK